MWYLADWPGCADWPGMRVMRMMTSRAISSFGCVNQPVYYVYTVGCVSVLSWLLTLPWKGDRW